MREIKFRAWLKDKREMCEVLMINFQKSYIGVKTKDYNIIQVGISWKYTQKVAWFDDVELMQYTGLKDKNGKEIYEGDVLSKESYWGWFVGFEDGAFCKVPLNEVQRLNWEHYRLIQDKISDWEIIGNIYENPELLEVE